MVESYAKLVWDGDDTIRIPEEMGQPRSDQMLGTVGERLSELAGRVCYDSLGKGRNSAEYHSHLLEVGHGSVFEHYTRIFGVTPCPTYSLIVERVLPLIFLNRRGVWVEYDRSAGFFRLTMNIRCVLDWFNWSNSWLDAQGRQLNTEAGFLLQEAWSRLVPTIVTRPDSVLDRLIGSVFEIEPKSDHEKWISLYMVGSRGFSHEQVRHGDETAISQRSTRYVEESESPWVLHPLIKAYLDEANGEEKAEVLRQIDGTVVSSRNTYDFLVSKLEKWLLSKLPEDTPFRKATARKQARGASRGFLGNALQTELIFSASVAQWRHMIQMRASDAADGEIRLVYGSAVPALKQSRYGDRFEDIVLEPASDGLGLSLKGGGAK